MINDTSKNLALPLPHQDNDLADDVLRLRAALSAIDDYLKALQTHAAAIGNIHGLKASDIGLGNVNNTADTDKPVSTAQNALIDSTLFLNSGRDFPFGTLITTSIDYSTDGDPFVLEIDGNSYGGGLPMLTRFQGYIYGGSIYNIGGFALGYYIMGLVALNVDGKLCFWFPFQSYWQGFSVFVSTSYAGRKRNSVVKIENVAKPTNATQEFNVSNHITKVIHENNIINYAPKLNGTGATGTWPISINGSSALTLFSSVIDGARDAAAIPSNWSAHSVRWDLVHSQTTGSPGSDYSGVMTFVPSEGQTDGGGGNAYQLAFGSDGQYGLIPDLKVRNGADGGWNTWYTVWHAGNLNFTVQAYANALVQRDGNGYLNGNYTYMTDEGIKGNGATGSVTGIICKRGDNYYRNTSAAAVKAFLGMTGADISTLRSNTATDIGTSRELRWNKFGNNNTVVDLSSGYAPDGSAKSAVDPDNVWSDTSPTLMGYNGTFTYGVRVDSARMADRLAESTNTSYTYTNGVLTGMKELMRGAVPRTTGITYGVDGSVDTVTITTGNRTRKETYTYANGSISGMSATET